MQCVNKHLSTNTSLSVSFSGLTTLIHYLVQETPSPDTQHESFYQSLFTLPLCLSPTLPSLSHNLGFSEKDHGLLLTGVYYFFPYPGPVCLGTSGTHLKLEVESPFFFSTSFKVISLLYQSTREIFLARRDIQLTKLPRYYLRLYGQPSNKVKRSIFSVITFSVTILYISVLYICKTQLS